MRASVASRHFALQNGLLLAAGLGLLQAPRVGWRWVTSSPAIEPTRSTTPAGEGWIHVAATPRPLPPDYPPEIAVDLWWNPAQAVIGVVGAFVGGLLVLGALGKLLRMGVTLAHQPAYRRDQRMTAAIQYGTGWSPPLLVAVLILGFLPLSYLGEVADWAWYPPRSGFIVASAVVAAFGATAWWFWLVQLGATAPVNTRGRVIAFFVFGVPLLVAGATVVWWLGLDRLYGPVFRALNTEF
jgi:hypothetical protein